MTMIVLVIDDELGRLDYKRSEFLSQWSLSPEGNFNTLVTYEFITSQRQEGDRLVNDESLAAQHIAGNPDRYALVLLDMQFDHGLVLPGGEPSASDRQFGLKIQALLAREFPSLPVVQFSAQLQETFSQQDGVYLSKLSGTTDDLRQLLVRHGRASLVDKAALLRVPQDTVVASAASIDLYSRAYMLGTASAPTPVLIRGETGTGKEHLARYLHTISPRHNEPWLPIQISALTSALFESELYGHEKGAFTGADRVHLGAFTRVGGGTLFLDEIGALPTDLQSKLLRVIGERRFKRVGGTVELTVACGVVAATQDDLEANGSREDLFARFNVLRIPALRERAEEILGLAEHFLVRIQAQEQKRGMVFSAAARDALLHMNFHDNARGVRRVVEHAVLSVSSNGVIQPDHFGEGAERRPPVALAVAPKPQELSAPVHAPVRFPESTEPQSDVAPPSFEYVMSLLEAVDAPKTPERLLGLLTEFERVVQLAQKRLAIAALTACKDPVRDKFKIGPVVQLLTGRAHVTTTNARRTLAGLLGVSRDLSLDQQEIKAICRDGAVSDARSASALSAEQRNQQ